MVSGPKHTNTQTNQVLVDLWTPHTEKVGLIPSLGEVWDFSGLEHIYYTIRSYYYQFNVIDIGDSAWIICHLIDSC